MSISEAANKNHEELVALDQACVDLIYKSEDPGKASLIHRLEEKNGIYTVKQAAKLGIGSKDYELIDIH